MRHRLIRLAFAALLLAGLGAPASAWAHAAASTAPAPAASGPDLGGAVLAGLSALAILASARYRRVRLLALVLLLSLAAFEAAEHSVHHLGNPRAADRCLVASSAQHVSAVGIDVPIAPDPLRPSRDATPPEPPSVVRVVSLAPDAGRAPPA